VGDPSPRFDPYLAVRAFHEAFGVAAADRPTVPTEAVRALRARLLREELDETLEALEGDDLARIASELSDLIYVAYGTAVSLGIDIRPVFEAVHAANMRKQGGGTRADGKVLKPPGWQPADVAAILNAQTAD